MPENNTLVSPATDKSCKTDLRLEQRADGRLWISNNGEETAVRVNRCFPWSEPQHFLSLRDDDDREVALIGELRALDGKSMQALERALAEAGFVMEITGVEEIKEDYEIRSWRVITQQGPRTFQTMLDFWLLTLPGGSLLISDIAGDLFHLENPETLDEKSQDLIWVFVG